MDKITLTHQNIHALAGSPTGHGFTNAQLRLLGVPLPARRGWVHALVGKEIPLADYEAAKKLIRPKWEKAKEAEPGMVHGLFVFTEAGSPFCQMLEMSIPRSQLAPHPQPNRQPHHSKE